MRLHKAVVNPFRYSLSYYQNGENNYITGTPHGYNFSDITLTTSMFYCYPFFLPRDFFVKQYGIVFGTFTSAGYVNFGFYEELKSNVMGPSGLIDSADNINITATGFYSKTLGVPLRLKGGKLYWGAIQTNTAIAGSIKGPQRNHPFLPMYVVSFSALIKPNGYAIPRSWTNPMVTPAPAVDPTSWEIQRPAILFFREPNQNGT